jgi:hypothetical protein
MQLTKEQLKQIIIDELRNVLKEFKMPDVDIDIPMAQPEEQEYNQIQPASHDKAQMELQRQCGIKQGR